MRRHVAILGFAYVIIGGFIALGALAAFLFGLGGGVAALFSGGEGAVLGGVLAVLGGTLAAVVVLVLAGLNLLTGFGILARRSWGRGLGVVASVLNVLSFSLMTLLGVYGLWVLLSQEGRREFESGRL